MLRHRRHRVCGPGCLRENRRAVFRTHGGRLRRQRQPDALGACSPLLFARSGTRGEDGRREFPDNPRRQNVR